jgi:hypothetical protein
MRTVAQWAFSALRESAERCSADYQTAISVVERWINAKGSVQAGGSILVYPDGRKAALESHPITCSLGRANSWKLTEPTFEGRFMTEISIAASGGDLAFSCVLSAGGAGSILAPVSVDVRCPHLVRSVVDLGFGWRVGETVVRTAPVQFRTAPESALLMDILRRPERALPVVVISEYNGQPLFPQISETLALELTGLAIVIQISDQTSWELTRNFGREWSCFWGAIRLYWPFRDARGDPRTHPLWTAERLVEDTASTEEAGFRIRTTLRRRLFGLSALVVEPSRMFETIRRTTLDEELAERRKFAEAHDTFQDLAESYARDAQMAREELETERETNRQLRQELYNLQARLAWRDNGTDLVPSIESPLPTTAEEAVDRARKVLAQFLTFGDDVAEGVRTLSPDAGPPDKIFNHLQALADLAQVRRDGTMGCGMVQWLSREGVSASGESDTIRNTRSEMVKRRWGDGRQPKEFDLHIKTAEATAPNRCVRIYFDWDQVTEKVVIGWVGKHP